MAMVGGTAACAFLIGYTMQQTSPAPQRVTAAAEAPAELPAEPLQLENVQLTSVPAAQQPVIDAPVALETDTLATVCPVSAEASAVAGANVQLRITAPCNANERISVHHSGMMFTAVTSSDGSLSVTVPALSATAVFVAELASGKGAVATAEVADLDSVERVVLQWSGNSGLEIHAREFGADYGEDGHVWSGGEARSVSSQVVRLGDGDLLAPRLAEVYSFAHGSTDATGQVRLSIEAEVSQLNCGREISAQSLEIRQGAGLRTRDLVMSMPDCDAAGDFLVLNNLVEDLKIAAK
jgi:hypothetical protein